MSRIDPKHVVVFVRDSSDSIVRIGVSSWSDLRGVINRVEGDDVRQFQDIDAQMAKAKQAGIMSS